MLGVAIPRNGSECESVILDPDGIIRCYVAHDLNGRGMSFMLEVLRLSTLIIKEAPYQSPVGCFRPSDIEAVPSSETNRAGCHRLRGTSA